ncbi:16S rRNA (uracil(1498)-N(3))-methyltransferase [Nesterenkonia cremea]|uniref:Ribosomal RNA small subunit methyltransferase E n=1 Tax=Nesterenkonia cremea TaxID=1882340 RepID=A0A917AP70_9MICC|nr:16S rRNA (uracil(1498)-N(3))-methyltransferase [Nesterenkonia cremea]GGE62839.1 ribosomal RNA small subunit methyltransferase E [Nesterenkonia cremea]
MTAPLFHLSPGSLDGLAPGSQVTLDGAEGHHAATVMRLGAGEQVQLSDTQRLRVTGMVLDAGTGELVVEVQEISEEPLERPALVLVQALAKDKRDLQAVESATELGVDAVIPWQAERSVARWKAGREAKKHAEWVNTATTAAKQTRRTAIPEVRQLHTTAQYVRSLGEQEGVGVVVLHEVEEISLAAVLEQLEAPQLDELHLVVGPEGGISQAEIAQLTEAGARTARLGRSVLRSSTAGPAGIAGAQVLLGRWDW